MANIKSAKKRIKIIRAKTLHNKVAKSALRTYLKKADAALANGAEDCAEVIRLAIKKVDQAAAKGILHKNNAARKKSALARKLNAIAG